ncbi:MAG: carboxymuconolactone decarboxylase family protein [Acidimicrobiales bacterium]
MSERTSREPEWTFQWEGPVHEVFPALHAAQSAWLSEVDELPAPDRKTRELIRLVCTVLVRSAAGVERHARLAAEYGATWDEVLGALLLTSPSFGVLPAAEMTGPARKGFEAASSVEPGEPVEPGEDDAD